VSRLANCPSCGADARQGDWTCRACGSPLSSSAPETPGYGEPAYDRSYYQEPTIYGTAAPASRPAAAGTSGGSKLSWFVLLAVVAIAALAGVWFFALRPATGQQFLGTWQGTAVTSAGSAPHAVTISRNGARYLITDVTGKRTIGPFSAVLKDGHLETTYDYAGHDAAQAAALAAVKNALDLAFKDYHVVLSVDHETLTISVEGTPVSSTTTTVGGTERLTKAD
jgi:hypothetical protein